MEIAIIGALTLLNGFFALAEIALVSVKKGRIEALAAGGHARARLVLRLLEKPENFLSSVQVGITLIGIVSGAYGGAALTDNLERFLLGLGFPPAYAHGSALGLVITLITYFSIVVGELVPKSIAMRYAEPISLACAPVINFTTRAAFPFVKLLSASTQLLIRLVGIRASEGERMSEEELRLILRSAGTQGLLESEESDAHQNLFSFSDQTARALMTHSSDLEWIDCEQDKETIFHQIKESAHSKFIVSQGELNQIRGIVAVKDFLGQYSQPDFSFEKILREPLFVAPGTPAFKIIALFRARKQYVGVVVDEYGSVLGMITLHDLFEAIVGDLPDEDESETPSITLREDGSFLLDGKALVYEINQYFREELIPLRPSEYTTVSGFILEVLKAIPAEGQLVETPAARYEILDMDGIRIDKILMRRTDAAAQGSAKS